jgi:hypothetical protein
VSGAEQQEPFFIPPAACNRASASAGIVNSFFSGRAHTIIIIILSGCDIGAELPK